MRRNARSPLQSGVVFGVAAVYVCLVGVVETFRQRWIIGEVLGLGQAILFMTALAAGYVAARRTGAGGARAVLGGLGAGVIVGASLAVLLLVAANDARHIEPFDSADRDEDERKMTAERHDQQNDEEHERQRIENIDKAHHQGVEPTADIAGNRAIGNANQQRDR